MIISTPTILFIGVAGLMAIGLYGLLAVRNLIKAIVALQILIKGVVLGFVLAGRMAGNVTFGQSMAILIIVVDTIVAVVGLALAVQIRKHFGTLDVKAITTLRR